MCLCEWRQQPEPKPVWFAARHSDTQAGGGLAGSERDVFCCSFMVTVTLNHCELSLPSTPDEQLASHTPAVWTGAFLCSTGLSICLHTHTNKIYLWYNSTPAQSVRYDVITALQLLSSVMSLKKKKQAKKLRIGSCQYVNDKQETLWVRITSGSTWIIQELLLTANPKASSVWPTSEETDMKIQTFLHIHHLWEENSIFILKDGTFQMVNIDTMSDKSRWIIDVCWEETHALIGQDVEVVGVLWHNALFFYPNVRHSNSIC